MIELKAELEKTISLYQQTEKHAAELEKQITAALTAAPEKVGSIQAEITNNSAIQKRYADRIDALKAEIEKAGIEAMKEQAAALTEHHIKLYQDALQRYEKAIAKLEKAYQDALKEQSELFAVRPRSLAAELWNVQSSFPVLPLSNWYLEIRQVNTPDSLTRYRKGWEKTKAENVEAIRKMYAKELQRNVEAGRREIKLIMPPVA